VTIDPVGDHRIAMSFALVGLRRPGTRVADPEVVAKSYPGFWDDFESLLG
jgi:3-phosphoshikimate 1-carboxyvinyltransferase